MYIKDNAYNGYSNSNFNVTAIIEASLYLGIPSWCQKVDSF